jgi:HPt (histidine-containing phosphotransfer) domain-containing protein
MIEVLSSDTREIEVIADPARLAAAGLTIGDVADGLAASNTLQPVGRYTAAGLQHLVLSSSLWAKVEDIPQTPILVKGSTTIRVADVATVQQGAPDRTSLVSGNGKAATSLQTEGAAGHIDWQSALTAVDGDKPLLRELVVVFLEETPRLLTGIDAAIASGDAPTVARLAHTLKGSVRHFAAPAAVIAADEIEMAARDNRLDVCSAKLPDLQAIFRSVLHEAESQAGQVFSPK